MLDEDEVSGMRRLGKWANVERMMGRASPKKVRKAGTRWEEGGHWDVVRVL